MIIARQQRRKNIAEYILYMWQVEDIIRAYGFDMQLIESNIVNRYDQPEKVKAEIRQWYADLIEMMRLERIEKTGHLQIVKNSVFDLFDLHLRLLDDFDKVYIALYRRAEPYIRELEIKQGGIVKNEIEVCLNALYGKLLLKLRQKEITPDTQEALDNISKMLAYLAKRYHENESR